MRCNEQIRISPVRVIDDQNQQLGVMPTAEALRMARERGVDLVEVQPNVRPPVCRLIDYGKWKYSQKKHQKKKVHEQQTKEVRIRPKTDDHDRDIKVKHATEFLEEGDKVQFTMVFRGRERAHREVAYESFNEIIQVLGDKIKVERPPSMDGRNMIMIVAPSKTLMDAIHAAEKARQQEADRELAKGKPRSHGDGHDGHDDKAPVGELGKALAAAGVAAPADRARGSDGRSDSPRREGDSNRPPRREGDSARPPRSTGDAARPPRGEGEAGKPPRADGDPARPPPKTATDGHNDKAPQGPQ